MVNRPDWYQNTCCFDCPRGRIAPRSLRLTDRARALGSDAFNQSNRVVPRKRRGEAPGPVVPTSGASESSTPCRLLMMPVCAGHMPERIVECPGAVSVTA